MSKPCYLIDLDGTLYKGDEPIPHADRFIHHLNRRGHRYILATNCPSRSSAEIAEKLDGMGMAVPKEYILTSGMATARYLRQRHVKRAFVIGEEVFRQELSKQGIEISDTNVQCVVVSWDREFCYSKLNQALWHLGNNTFFVCTNPDDTIPHGNTVIAHTGSICAAIEQASGRKAVYIGKPQKEMMQMIIEATGFPGEDMIVIGDRLDTDMLFARNNHVPGILTLTGHTNAKEAMGSTLPSLVIQNLSELIND